MELKFVQNQTDETVDVLIYDRIGVDPNTGTGIDGARFASEIAFLDTLDLNQINIRINSPGGSIVDGYSIFSSIQNTQTPTHTIIEGIAGSMAGPIALAGDKRSITDFGRLMMHNPNMGNKTKLSEQEKTALDSLRGSLLTIFENNTNVDLPKLSKMMDAETWLDASQALELGMVDEIISTQRAEDAENITADELMEFANEIFKTKTNKMELIKNHLELPEKTTENEVVEAIIDIQKGVDDVATLKTKHATEIETTTNDLETTKTDLANAKKEIVLLLNKNAELVVDSAINDGKFDKSNREQLIESAIKDVESFNKVVEAVKKPTVKIADIISNNVTTPNADPREGWNIRDWEKNAPKELNTMRTENQEKYNKLFNTYYQPQS